MVNSSFVFFPGIPVSRSRDLVHWETIGYVMADPCWAKEHLGPLEGGRGFWAPDISYHNGWFTVCATLRLNDDADHPIMYSYVRLSIIDVQLRTSEHRSMYS